MRDPARIPKVLEAVRAAWVKYPDLRLGQLIDNIARQPEGGRVDIFYLEDDQLIERLNKK